MPMIRLSIRFVFQIRIRSGVVIGRGGGMIQSLYLPFWLGVGGKIADGKQPLPWIHIEDICQLIKFCIENKDAKDVYNGVAPQIITNEDFTKVSQQSFALRLYFDCFPSFRHLLRC